MGTKELRDAYSAEFGSVPEEEVVLDFTERVIAPSEEQVENFKRHGLARINLKPPGVADKFILDISALQGARSAWFKGFQEENLGVLISSGTQKPPGKRLRYPWEKIKEWSIDFDPERIEGILVTLQYPARYNSSKTPTYQVQMKPLLRPQ